MIKYNINCFKFNCKSWVEVPVSWDSSVLASWNKSRTDCESMQGYATLVACEIFNLTKSTRQWGTAYFNSAQVDPISIGTILIDKILFARFAHLDLSILHSSEAPTRRHDFSARRVADEVFFRTRILLLDCIFCLLLCAFCPKTASNSWTLLVAQKKNLLLTGTSWLSGLSVLSQYSKLRKL